MRIALVRMFCAGFLVFVSSTLFAQDYLTGLAQSKDYIQKRESSYDRTGANFDLRRIPAGQSLTLLDADGPAIITLIWITIASADPHHLKALVLRMYWDGEATPSVEAPLGDFFGLGLGDYFLYHSIPLAVGPDRALNSFFPMPFQKHARITVTNEGGVETHALFYNIDYQAYKKPLRDGLLYFHAQYRQGTPTRGWTNQWKNDDDPLVDNKPNPNGENNYVWMEATGHGHFVGVTMSVLQNQDDWWG